ncbi:hypothetical protein RJT34_12868 [Clitoria ternatea]|uniref:Uncharacterized protein n=1 Tax=Clitoria ternatea TaxID=43366 RepID=A0AAN9JPM3_CLITE
MLSTQKMETVGSRFSRASSHCGTPFMFSGPVRKWKKKWVHVTPSSFHNTYHSHYHNTTITNNANASFRLFLCRWTPTTVDDAFNNLSDEPPRRKFYYTPVSLCHGGSDGLHGYVLSLDHVVVDIVRVTMIAILIMLAFCIIALLSAFAFHDNRLQKLFVGSVGLGVSVAMYASTLVAIVSHLCLSSTNNRGIKRF